MFIILIIDSVLLSDGYTAAVVLDTEDMDNYVQTAYIAVRTPEILCLKCKHSLTGCEHNSDF